MKKNAVVIIIYKQNPNYIERASFKQCLSIMREKHIILVCPQSLDTKYYFDIAKIEGVDLHTECFKDSFFFSVSSYNQLMLSLLFYERFMRFEYILIYQLDAWIFRDELDYWTTKEYDYIGAPWFTPKGTLANLSGNGGFSLRKVESFLLFLSLWKNDKVLYTIIDIMKAYFDTPEYPFVCFKYFKDLHLRKIFFRSIAQRNFEGNEDAVYAFFFKLSGKFKIAPSSIAMRFAFETFPEKLFIRTRSLPFGCHAFEKYSPTFWENWIPCLNNKQ